MIERRLSCTVVYRVLDAASIEGRRKLVADELGARAIRLNRFDSQPNQPGKEHDEVGSGQEEIYVPVEGNGVLVVGDERSRWSPGASCS